MITTIIFDWHGVLDTTRYQGLIKTLAEQAKLSIEEVTEKIAAAGKNYERGSIEPAVFWQTAQTALGLDDGGIKAAKSYILRVERNQPVWDLLAELQQKYQLAVLSDCPKDKAAVIRRTADLSMFAATWFSSEIGQTKNSDSYFLGLAGQLGADPTRTLYFDDTPRHVDTALRLGFRAYVFTGPDVVTSAVASASIDGR